MKSNYLKGTTLFLALLIIFNTFYFRPKNILSYDVFGYYLYLPLTFINHDLKLEHPEAVQKIISQYHSSGSFYQAFHTPEGKAVLKYTMGLSFLYAPFFFLGDLAAHLSGDPVDGFSQPYQLAILLCGLIYALLGIWALGKVLRRFFSDKISAAVLALVVLGTNYLIHVTYHGQNAMTHNYLVTGYALLLWFTLRWHETCRWKYSILLAVTCGLIIIIRPSEGLCLLIPLLWGIKNRETLDRKIRMFLEHRSQVAIFMLLLILVGSLQMVYWKIQAGSFLFNSYGNNAGEGFRFRNPYLMEVLFSFRKGWLVYTPLMIFAITGIFIQFFRERKAGIQPSSGISLAIAVYFILNLYVVSSWSCWWYAQSFGQRALIPSYAVLAIPLGYFLTWLSSARIPVRVIGIVLVVMCLVLNLFQSLQYRKGVIRGDRMTREYYFATFGSLKNHSENEKLLMINRQIRSKHKIPNPDMYTRKIARFRNFENGVQADSTVAFSGRYSLKMDSTRQFGGGYVTSFRQITGKDHAWIRVSAWIYPKASLSSNMFVAVAHFMHDYKAYEYELIAPDTAQYKINQWNRFTFDYLTPEVYFKSDTMKVYFWLQGKKPVYVDNVSVEIFEPKE